MDLRQPRRNYFKRPPSIVSAVALLSFMLVFVGMCASTSATPSTELTDRGWLFEATRRIRDSNDAIPDILFGLGAAVAMIFIVVYVFTTVRGTDPRSGRYRAD